MDWKAIHGPASCSSHADMGAQLTSLMDDGMTVYCGLGVSPAIAPSSPFGPCSRPSLADKLTFRPTFLRRSFLTVAVVPVQVEPSLHEAHMDTGSREWSAHLASLVLKANLRSIPRVYAFGKLRLVGSS